MHTGEGTLDEESDDLDSDLSFATVPTAFASHFTSAALNFSFIQRWFELMISKLPS